MRSSEPRERMEGLTKESGGNRKLPGRKMTKNNMSSRSKNIYVLNIPKRKNKRGVNLFYNSYLERPCPSPPPQKQAGEGNNLWSHSSCSPNVSRFSSFVEPVLGFQHFPLTDWHTESSAEHRLHTRSSPKSQPSKCSPWRLLVWVGHHDYGLETVLSPLTEACRPEGCCCCPALRSVLGASSSGQRRRRAISTRDSS